MSIEIDWIAFIEVLIVALIAASFLVLFYALGVRMLVRAGKPPVVAPADFPEAITTMKPKEIKKAEKAAAKAAKKSPLSQGQKKFAMVLAVACFVVCALVILTGLFLIVTK